MATPAPGTPPLPVELSDEPLVGWRCWFVLPDELLLRPIYKRGLAWKPRQALEAVCPESLHEVPDETCKCGVWTVCHPMLLDEIGWRTAPPMGIDSLPGILVIGEVSLWGKIVQHERGWRASVAYPRHLYVFTGDPLVAETLRERYGVPVEYGSDAERLRRFLPPNADEEEDEPAPLLTVPEAMLAVVDEGLCPAPLRALLERAIAAAELAKSPQERAAAARRVLDAWIGRPWREARAAERRNLSLAHADARALAGDVRAAARASWVRLVRWQRARGEKLGAEIARERQVVDEEREGCARGTNPRTNAAYKPTTLYQKRRRLAIGEKRLAELEPRVEAVMAVEIPTYRAWRAMIAAIAPAPRSALPGPSLENLEAWHRNAMRREERLAEQERALILARHRLRQEQAALQAERAAIEADAATVADSRAELRADVVAEVRRDHEALLREVAALERRRRAALAFLPAESAPNAARDGADISSSATGVRSPAPVRVATTATPPTEVQALREDLAAHDITQADVARAAGTGASSVCQFFAGRMKSASIAATARRLLEERKATPTAETSDPRRADAPAARFGAHPALAARLENLGLTHYQVAVRVPCSRSTVTAVLHGRLVGKRGANARVLAAAERLIADVEAGSVELPPRAPNAGAWTRAREVDVVREGLRRERAELDELRRQAADARKVAARERRRAITERKQAVRAAEALRTRQRAMHKTAGLRQRLDTAGVLLTQVARAARVDLSAVSRVLSGTYYSERVVVAAEKLLSRAPGLRRRASARG